MIRSALLLSLCLAAAAPCAVADETPPAAAPPTAPSSQAMQAVRAACASDVQKLCAGVQPGGGRIIACLKEHKDEVSDGCKQAIAKAKQNPS